MLVKDIMQTQVVSATPETRVADLLRVLQRRGIRHLPVMDGGKLAGLVSDRDIKQAMTSAALSTEGADRERLLERLTAGQIMTRSVVTIGPMFGVEDAARIMVTRKISALPVIEAERVVGIVTETDLLALFVRAMGVLEPSSRVEVVLGDSETLGAAVQAVEAAGVRVTSVMTLQDPDGKREVVLRLATIDPRPAVARLHAAGCSVRDFRGA
jgi:acetoin utilization protein AcuB